MTRLRGAALLVCLLGMVPLSGWGCKQEKTHGALGEVDRYQSVERQCLSQVRYLSVAFQRYMDDNKGRLPGEDWQDAVVRCGARQEWLKCPAGATEGHSDYMFNKYLAGVNTREIQDPEKIVLLTEGTQIMGGPDDVSARHDGKVTVAYLGGEVKQVRVSSLLEARWKP